MENNFEIFGKYYDNIYLKMKNYESEAEIIKNVIRKFEKKKSATLLDIGCGTGEHLKNLSNNFQCTGIDIDRNMIRIAKNKVPNTNFKVANMVNLRLKEKFDVIICLFSAIGYVKTLNNLVKTLENFHNSLNSKGIAIVEPWVFKSAFKKGKIGLDTYEDEKLKLARMATSRIVKSQWLVFMHYLLGENGKISHFSETHKMLACDYQDYVEAFKSANFKNVMFLKENLWENSRGLFIATK